MISPGDLVARQLTIRDVTTLERVVHRYHMLGLEATLQSDGVQDGLASIWHVDPRQRIADTYQLEVGKYTTSFGRMVWVVEVSRSVGLAMIKQYLDRVSSNVLLFAITKAEQIVAAAQASEPKTSLGRKVRDWSDLRKLNTLAEIVSSGPLRRPQGWVRETTDGITSISALSAAQD